MIRAPPPPLKCVLGQALKKCEQDNVQQRWLLPAVAGAKNERRGIHEEDVPVDDVNIGTYRPLPFVPNRGESTSCICMDQ